MATSKITIPLDPEAARAYEAAPEEQKRKLQTLLSLWLRELVIADPASLHDIMDEVSRKARARGLTAATLEALLKGA